MKLCRQVQSQLASLESDAKGRFPGLTLNHYLVIKSCLIILVWVMLVGVALGILSTIGTLRISLRLPGLGPGDSINSSSTYVSIYSNYLRSKLSDLLITSGEGAQRLLR